MPTWTLPTDPHSVGDTGHTTDHNSIVGDLTLIGGILPIVAGGLAGAVQAARFAGATTSGAPSTGTFAVGDFVVDRTSGTMWLCVTAGSPGTWVSLVNTSAAQTIAGAKTFTGGVVIEQSSGNALIVSSDGTATADGAVVVNQNGSDSYLAVYSAGAGTYYGVSAGIVSGIVSLFGYYVGLGVIGVTTGTGSPVFGALASDQFGSGLGSTAFTVYDDNGVTTFNNTLDDGSGNAAVAGTSTVSGVSHLNGGTDTSGTAAASSPAFASGTALQLSTTQDVMLYIDVTVATNLTLAIGSTSSATTTIFTSATAAIGVITLRVPKGWYVKATSTGTFANFGFKQVTC